MVFAYSHDHLIQVTFGQATVRDQALQSEDSKIFSKSFFQKKKSSTKVTENRNSFVCCFSFLIIYVILFVFFTIARSTKSTELLLFLLSAASFFLFLHPYVFMLWVRGGAAEVALAVDVHEERRVLAA